MTTSASLLLIAALTLGACLHPGPNPGSVVLSCLSDASNDPKLLNALLDALAKPSFMSAITDLISPALGWTAEVVACALHSFLGSKVAATPTAALERQHARAYLAAHGYQVP